MNQTIIQIRNYTPCRLTESFFDSANMVVVATNKGSFRLKDSGRFIWYLLDGKHSISDIVDRLCTEFGSNDIEQIQTELIYYLNILKQKNAIIVNWDPIYKYDLCQELT